MEVRGREERPGVRSYRSRADGTCYLRGYYTDCLPGTLMETWHQRGVRSCPGRTYSPSKGGREGEPGMSTKEWNHVMYFPRSPSRVQKWRPSRWPWHTAHPRDLLLVPHLLSILSLTLVFIRCGSFHNCHPSTVLFLTHISVYWKVSKSPNEFIVCPSRSALAFCTWTMCYAADVTLLASPCSEIDLVPLQRPPPIEPQDHVWLRNILFGCLLGHLFVYTSVCVGIVYTCLYFMLHLLLEILENACVNMIRSEK